jgi:hypothetical protein
MPKPGPVFYISAEDEERELRLRLTSIAAFYGTTPAGLRAAGLHLVSLSDVDPYCFTVQAKSEHVIATALFDWIVDTARLIRPVNIILDPITDVSDIEEIKRRQVVGLYRHGRRLAIAADSGLIFTGHLSKLGEYSGSTAYNNSARGRFSVDKPEDMGPTRTLVHHKNQFGPLAPPLLLEWKDGLWQMAAQQGPASRKDRLAEIDHLTLELIKADLEEGNGIVSYIPHAGAQLAMKNDARDNPVKVSPREFQQSLERLKAAKAIHPGEGRSGNRHKREVWMPT